MLDVRRHLNRMGSGLREALHRMVVGKTTRNHQLETLRRSHNTEYRWATPVALWQHGQARWTTESASKTKPQRAEDAKKPEGIELRKWWAHSSGEGPWLLSYGNNSRDQPWGDRLLPWDWTLGIKPQLNLRKCWQCRGESTGTGWWGAMYTGQELEGRRRGAGLREVIAGNARLSEHPQHPLKAWHKAAWGERAITSGAEKCTDEGKGIFSSSQIGNGL